MLFDICIFSQAVIMLGLYGRNSAEFIMYKRINVHATIVSTCHAQSIYMSKHCTSNNKFTHKALFKMFYNAFFYATLD